MSRSEDHMLAFIPRWGICWRTGATCRLPVTTQADVNYIKVISLFNHLRCWPARPQCRDLTPSLLDAEFINQWHKVPVFQSQNQKSHFPVYFCHTSFYPNFWQNWDIYLKSVIQLPELVSSVSCHCRHHQLNSTFGLGHHENSYVFMNGFWVSGLRIWSTWPRWLHHTSWKVCRGEIQSLFNRRPCSQLEKGGRPQMEKVKYLESCLLV